MRAPERWLVSCFPSHGTVSIRNHDDETIAEVRRRRTLEERDAAARLVAAAPELLCAVRVARTFVAATDPGDPIQTLVMGMLNAAVRKAEGGPANGA
jgi:hypothetical protein